MEKKYYLEFDTKDGTKENPRIIATFVSLGSEVVTDQNTKFPLNLCEHPLYKKLERYVKNNPSR